MSKASTLTPARPACEVAAVTVPDTVPLDPTAGLAPASASSAATRIAFSARLHMALARVDGAGRELSRAGRAADHALLRTDHARRRRGVLLPRGGRRVGRPQPGVRAEHLVEP